MSSSSRSPSAASTGKSDTRSTYTTPTLPSKFRVPPLPPSIHRRLELRSTDDGLLIQPAGHTNTEEAILITWGPKGTVQRYQPAKDTGYNNTDADAETLEIGGILGITRLWATAYLFIFIEPPTGPAAPIKIFPPEEKRSFPALPLKTPSVVEEGDPLLERLRAIAEREGILPPSPTSDSPGRDWRNAFRQGLSRGTTVDAVPTVTGSTPRDQPRSLTDDEEDKTTGQGTVFELRNVYAVPLAKVGAEALMKQIRGAIVKLRPRAAPEPAPTTVDTGAADAQAPTESVDSAQPAGDAETPLEAFARIMNPKQWQQLQLPKFSVPKPSTRKTSTSDAQPLDDPEGKGETGAMPSNTHEALPSESGDLGETPLVHLEESSTASEVHQQQDKNHPSDPGASAGGDGLPQPDEVMANVPGTQTEQEREKGKKRESFLGVEWNKINIFGNKGKDARGDKKTDRAVKGNADTIEAQVPGVLVDLTEEQRRELDVEDGIAMESSTASLDSKNGKADKVSPTRSVSQRKDLEAKIVREMVRDLGSGGFFYSFETDLSHTLQHKRKQLSARNHSTGLLQTLLKKENQGPRSPLDLGSTESTPAEEKSSKTVLGDASLVSGGGLQAAAEISDNKPKDQTEDNSDLARQLRGETWIEPDVSLPLWRRIDPTFFWNAWMLREFIDLGLHSFILPLIQGWVQSSRFYIPPPAVAPMDPAQATMTSPQMLGKKSNSIDNDLGPPSTPVDIAVISRRSKDRAGLRFQRRGIDEDGNVANFVETEMLIRVKVEDKWSIFSFIQIRGSIPLFWSQSSTLTDMKPAPVLIRPVEQSIGTAKLHFDELKRRYGPQTIINLAEITGKESVVTLGYRDVVKALDDKDVRYTEFDFHNECKGMKYENIGKLIDQLSSSFSEQGYFWTCQGEVMREQSGTFRVNCIDCLDRTNVVESALARHTLTNQLTQVGRTPERLTPAMEWVFNDMWANNGDQISRLYAGTSALKGDFTRTGKRDLTGLLNDGLNSVTRMGRGAIGDFFSQAVISFMVGERNLTVFSEVLANLGSVDKTSLVRLSRIRAAAVETCSARVLEEGERKIYGWTLFSPEEPNMRFTQKLEEKILLISQLAIYVVSFDYDLEKVVSSTRIPLRSVTSIQKGAYILSPLQEAGRDPEENAGFLFRFRPVKNDTRLTTYSMMNSPSKAKARTESLDAADDGTEFFAFKALPREFVTPGADEDDDNDRGKQETCREVVDKIVERIRGECARAEGSGGGYAGSPARNDGFITQGDIVSLAEAQKGTSIVARADYALKRFLWIP